MRKLTDEQCKAALESHRQYLIGEKGGERADFADCDLRSANLRSANLGSANLYGANLYGADLGGADLYGANLRSANLRSANLGGANLRSANLGSANLGSANLYGANLGGANLYGANLGGANLYGANLRSANLGGANLGSKTVLGSMLSLIGACTDSVIWVDGQKDHSKPMALFETAAGDWRAWLAERLGGLPCPERLFYAVEFVIGGRDRLAAWWPELETRGLFDAEKQ